MELLLGDKVTLTFETQRHGATTVQGTVTAIGEDGMNPDGFFVEIAGISARFYSSEFEVTKNG